MPAAAAASRSLAECFRLFDVIHRITTDLATITRITAEVLEDFAAENVVYLELRTTPKVLYAVLALLCTLMCGGTGAYMALCRILNRQWLYFFHG